MAEAVGILIIGEELGKTVAFSTLTYGALAGSAAISAGLIGLQYAIKLATPAPKPDQGREALRSPKASRLFGYGRVRVAGAYMLFEERNSNSYDVCAIHQGRICGFVKFFLHEDEVVVDPDIGGYCVAYNADGRYQTNRVQWLLRKGLPTETAITEITTPLSVWTSSHRGDGIASIGLICVGVPAADFRLRYPNGLPKPSVVVDALAIWDPRDEGQDPDDAATWTNYPAYNGATSYTAGARVLFGGAVYIARTSGLLDPPWVADDGRSGHASYQEGTIEIWNHAEWAAPFRNPVLQIINYLTNTDHGMSLPRETVIDPVIDDLMAEADLCDALVFDKEGDVEPRYVSSGWATFETEPAQVLGNILAACDGWMAETGDGALALKVGVYRAPTVTIASKHIVGFGASYGRADEESVNELGLTFVSPKHKYKEMPGQSWRDEDAITETGKVRSQSLPLTWVQAHSQARRLAKRAMLRNAATLRGTIVTTLYGLTAISERWVTLQYPFLAGLEDAVVEIQPNPQIDIVAGRVTFQWVKIDPATIDAWNPITEEGREPPNPDDLSGQSLPIPQNVAAVAGGGGSDPYHINVSWDEEPDWSGLGWAVRYRIAVLSEADAFPDAVTESPWTVVEFGAIAAVAGRVNAVIYPPSEDQYVIEAASIGPSGSYSDWSEPVIAALQSGTLDYSLAQNSGNLVLLLP